MHKDLTVFTSILKSSNLQNINKNGYVQAVSNHSKFVELGEIKTLTILELDFTGVILEMSAFQKKI